MNRATRFLLMGSLVAGALVAAGFVRSTTVPGDPGAGRCLWWGNRHVTFVVNATSAATAPCYGAGVDAAADAAAAAALAATSVQTWNTATKTGDGAPCTDFSFTYGGASTSIAVGNGGGNLVVFRSGFCEDIALGDACHAALTCANKFNCWEQPDDLTYGLTTTTFDTATGEIFDADIELNGWNGAFGGISGQPRGAYLTCGATTDRTCTSPGYPDTGCNWIDVGELVTHEAGHVLGLDHTCDYLAPYNSCPGGSQGTVMAPSFLPGHTARRQLAPDDVDGVCTIYPAGGPTLTCGSSASKTAAAGCGCGSVGSGAAALVGLALALALRPRRAR